MRLRTVVWCSILIASFVGVARTQTPPKPGPEAQKLQVFVGTWTMEGETKMDPKGKVTGTDTIDSLGGFFVRRNFQGKGPTGDVKGTHIWGYDPVKKAYVQSSYDSDGGYGSGTVTVSGNTWTFTSSGVVGGQAAQERCIGTFGANNTSLTIKCEGSMDGGKTWAPTFEGKSTKK